MKSYAVVILLILGIVAGIAATKYGPGLLKPMLPQGMTRDTAKTVEAIVIDKRKESGTLLLTVDSEEGAMLVTFNTKVSEIDLLVKKGYIVTFGIKKYEPFVTNPVIKKVKRVPVEDEDVALEKKVEQELKQDAMNKEAKPAADVKAQGAKPAAKPAETSPAMAPAMVNSSTK